jgi:hypothetical protein
MQKILTENSAALLSQCSAAACYGIKQGKQLSFLNLKIKLKSFQLIQ